MKIPRQRLFTPGPINTAQPVRNAMLRDMGSRDEGFIQIVRNIRRSLLAIAGEGAQLDYAAVLMQGSGTFAIEAAIGSLIPAGGRLLVLTNGVYGRRMIAIAQRLGIPVESIETPETVAHDPATAKARLAASPGISHVAVVHCETTTGIINPVAEIGNAVAAAGRQFIVDAMSSFGGIAMDVARWNIDCLVTTANKCLEGVPGVAIAIVRTAALRTAHGRARSVSLDLCAQWEEFERTGQFRFTPPTHVILALEAALDALGTEGGVAARESRYRHSQGALAAGMRAMGFRPVLTPGVQGPIITAFHFPSDGCFDFADFYRRLAARDLLIYPGKLSDIESFRIGTIGQITPRDITDLLDGIRVSLREMDIAVPLAG